MSGRPFIAWAVKNPEATTIILTHKRPPKGNKSWRIDFVNHTGLIIPLQIAERFWNLETIVRMEAEPVAVEISSRLLEEDSKHD